MKRQQPAVLMHPYPGEDSMYLQRIKGAVLAATLAVTVSPALADKPSPGRPGMRFGTMNVQRGMFDSNDIVKKNFEKLDKPVQLPNVPQFTGSAKFLYGQVARRERSGTGIAMRFSAHATPDAVTNFYREGLRGYGWTVQPTTSQYEVVATKGSDTCRVTIYPKMSTGTCDFYIAANLAK